ncbi:MAG: hypothetical protein ACMXYF_00985 [Candidatus Woesearchaeota archaeon]
MMKKSVRSMFLSRSLAATTSFVSGFYFGTTDQTMLRAIYDKYQPPEPTQYERQHIYNAHQIMRLYHEINH